ncbi:shikimate kinase [Phycomyces nitens]|nr:shikimate kinase [Phycomyces nitens]
MDPMQIFIVMGTAGCGKSSVAQELQSRLGFRFIEGDELHPASNVQKMAQGYPLTDEDRFPWLRSIRDKLLLQAQERQAQHSTDASQNGTIVTCSSLRKVYRDILSDIPSSLATVTFCYLKGSPELLATRIASRQNHFMKPGMLQSQLQTLEEPDSTKERVIVADIGFSVKQIVDSIISQAKQRHLLP